MKVSNEKMKAIPILAACLLALAQSDASPKWEYIGGNSLEEDDFLPSPDFKSRSESKEGSRANPSPFPSRRVGPGSWHDALGNWWLFGGQGPSANIELDDQSKTVHFLSDLWVYSPNETLPSSEIPSSSSSSRQYNWNLVFRPDVNSDSPYSSFPENLDFPLLCGSESSKHLALYGGHKNNPRASAESHNSPFSEDNVVWLYDIPQAFTREKVLGESVAAASLSSLQIQATGSGSSDAGNEERRKKTGCNWSSSSSSSPESCNGTGGESPQQEKQGLWTSYVCCDACLPDGNTTFEFCPQFSRDPISWCSKDSLMMLQLVLPSSSSGEGFDKLKENMEKAQTSIYSTSTTTFTSGPFDKSGGGGPSSASERHDSTDESGEQKGNFNTDMTATTTQKVASSSFVKHQIIPTDDSIQNKMNSQANAGRRRRRHNADAGDDNVVESKRGSPGSPAAVGSEDSNANFLKAAQQGEEQKPVGQEGKKGTELTESGESADSENRNGRKSGKMKRNGRDVIKDVGEGKRTIIASSIGQQSEKKAGKSGISNPGTSLNWWKFDLVSTEWIKMPEVNIEGELTDQVRNGDCRAVVCEGSQLVYILCPTKGNLLNRAVLLFDPEKTSVQLLGTLHLNNAFTDKKVWQLGRSVLHAIRCDNQTVILLGYHKLLDLWIHDHSSNRLYPVENVWKGSSLHSFQRTSSIYKLSISLPIPSSPKTFMKAGESPKLDRIDGNEEHNGKGETHSTYSFFMVNPRLKLANFDDWSSQAHFHITIVPDKEVFLPLRDASYLISSTEFQTDGNFPQDLSSHGQSFTHIGNGKDDSASDKKSEKKVAPGTKEKVALSEPQPPPLPSRQKFRGNEPSLSQTTLQAKSNQPLHEPPTEHGLGKGLFNSKSDKKAASEASPPALPIGRNPTEYAGEISQPAPSAVEFKGGDNDHDFMVSTSTSPTTKIFSTAPINSLSSLLLPGKSNQMEEHRRNKYRIDLKSPKRKSLAKQGLVRSGQEIRANMLLSKKRIMGVMRAISALTTTPASTHSTEDSHITNIPDVGGNSRTITSMPEVERTRSKIEINNATRRGLQPQVTFTLRNNSIVRVGNLTNDHVQNATIYSPASVTMQLARANPGKAENSTSAINGESNIAVIGGFHDGDTAVATDHGSSDASNNIHSNSENVAKSHAHSGKTSSDITLPNHEESNSNGMASNVPTSSTTDKAIADTPAIGELSGQIELENNQQKGKGFASGGSAARISASVSKMETTRKENRSRTRMATTDIRNFKIMIKGGSNESFSPGPITYNETRRNSTNAVGARAETATALNLPAPVGHEAPFKSHDYDSQPGDEHKSEGSMSPSATETSVAASSSSGSTVSHVPSVDTDEHDHDDGASSDVNLNQPQEQRYYPTKKESLNRVSVQRAASSKENDQLPKPTFSGWNPPRNLSLAGILSENSSKQSSSIVLQATYRDDTAAVDKNDIAEIRGLGILETPEKRAGNSLLPVQADVTSSDAVIAAVSNHRQYPDDEEDADKTIISPSTKFAMPGIKTIARPDYMRAQGDQSHTIGFMISPIETDESGESPSKNDRLSSSSKHFSQDPLHSHEEDTEVKGDNSKFSTLSTPSPSSSIVNNNDNYLGSHSHQEDEEGAVDSDSLLSPMTYGAMLEPRDDIMPFEQEGSFAGDTGYSSTIFFATTLSFFASIGVVLFIRRCVKCPPRTESVLIKEPPPIRYSVIPDDLSFHTPIV